MVRAKFFVESVTQLASPNAKAAQVNVVLRPIMADDVPENQRFHRYTPSGRLEMAIDNPPAAAQFEAGKVFYLDFTEVEK